ncbi:hypothetical protein [Pseudobacteriovorax antillogorgiicola]|uniref:Uncharacterized protein n=1 Tax=Pseudobacteriovorax antillogorgiicola TaxID=1513793 RepID=A0A1Y6BTM3_9BACT|nr:hypothetical protein [Pseudobacteriovorax antillogorgiicola]TCS53020.1 hypothetical protein EDD56_10871 [Pseudobacteriovorax antillogorgiicola]SMF26882.1 hypothetical protein SAMN06296036_108176 [Pseudobacteriovorax antillogorgiicola]
MLFEIGKALQPLFNFQCGVHLSLYLDAKDQEPREQIYDAIDQARVYLERAMTEVEQDAYLKPLINLAEDKHMLAQMKDCLGIFLNERSVRIIRIPFQVNPVLVVATSFHIKPLLKWLQIDRRFLVLGIRDEGLSLYDGTLTNIRKVDLAYELEEHDLALKAELRRRDCVELGACLEFDMDIVRRKLNAIRRKSDVPLYIIGDSSLRDKVVRTLAYPQKSTIHWHTAYDDCQIDQLCDEIRKTLKMKADFDFEEKLEEFMVATQLGKTNTRIDQIAYVATQGGVERLFVSEDLMLFGRIEPATGRITLHDRHRDHEDDDVLDDIAQIVLSKGGEVVVTPQSRMPGGGPVAAVFKYSGREGGDAIMLAKPPEFAISA